MVSLVSVWVEIELLKHSYLAVSFVASPASILAQSQRNVMSSL